MNKLKRISLIALLVIALGFKANSQGVLITFTNGDTEGFPLSSVQSVKFGSNSMILYEVDGTSAEWDIDDIDNYKIDESLNLYETDNLVEFQVLVYPNPSEDIVNIDFSESKFSVKATVEVLDGTGKKIKTLHHGMLSNDVLKWKPEVTRGTYYFKVLLKDRVITKPIIIN